MANASGSMSRMTAGGDLTNALVGELMLVQIAKRGVGGGAVRDSAYTRGRSFPVFAAGVTHRGPCKDGPGEINAPVAVDGVVVAPGDLALGGDDGLLPVPFAEVEDVLAEAAAKRNAVQKRMASIEAGTHDAGWVDAALRRLGCEGLD